MSDRDPAVSTWEEATESQLSTSATGRRLAEELDQLRADYNAELLTRAVLERELKDAARNVAELRQELTKAVQEIVRLRATQGQHSSTQDGDGHG
jgi:chromosome segregation ATPase